MKVLISAYLDNNIGDDLMIKLLAQKFPDHTFYMNTNNSTIKNSFKQSKNIIFHKFQMDKEYLKQFDVHLSIGGSIFNNLNTLFGIMQRIRRIFLLYRLKKNNIKLATIGCNLGPYKNKIGLLLTKKELELNSLVTVRDTESFNIIRKFSSIRNFHLASDIVFNFLSYLNQDSSKKSSSLGISTYRSIVNSEYNFSSYIFLAAIADNFIHKTGNKVYLFAFDSENENDLSAAHHIKNNSKYPECIEIVPYLGNHESFIECMRQCGRFVTIRFHSAIISQMLNIPFLPIVYSNKMENYLNDELYSGLRIDFKDMNIEKYNIDEIVNFIINNENIFNNFSKDKSDAKKHFDEFSKLGFKR